MKTKLKLHPLCEMFPIITESEMSALAEDIAAHGQREPIIVHQGMILDGQNRYAACLKIGIEPKTEKFTGKNATAFVISVNLMRRHLNESQRAMIAAQIANLKSGEKKTGENSSGQICTSNDEAAKLLNVSPRSVKSAKNVVNKGSKNLRELTKNGEVSVSAAATVSTHLSKAKQTKIAARGADAIKAKAAEIRTNPRGGLKGEKDLPPLVHSTTRDTSGIYGRDEKLPPLGTKPPKRTDTLPENERAKDAAELPKVTDAESARKRLRACYEKNTAWFNNVPLPPPSSVLEKYLNALIA